MTYIVSPASTDNYNFMIAQPMQPVLTNNDMSWLERTLARPGWEPDNERALLFSKLFMAFVMSKPGVDYFHRTFDGHTYQKPEFDLAKELAKKALTNPLVKNMVQLHDRQKVKESVLECEHNGFKFSVRGRCNYGLWLESLNWGGYLKPTSATTLDQFIKEVLYLNYDRRAAFYMDITGSKCYMLVGVSKKNKQLFHFPFERGCDYYNSGRDKYMELAFKHMILF